MQNVHVFVDPLASSLVLESCLGKIYGENTGNTHQSSNSTIDELGREACEQQKRVNKSINTPPKKIIVIVFPFFHFIQNQGTALKVKINVKEARQCQTDTSSNQHVQTIYNNTVAPKGFLLNTVVVFHT